MIYEKDQTIYHESFRILRWCPIVNNFVEENRCRYCQYADNTSGECIYSTRLWIKEVKNLMKRGEE